MPDPSPDTRLRLAAETTHLAWVRTGLSLMGFGFVVARFGFFLREFAAAEHAPDPSVGWSRAIGVAMVGLGVVVTVLSGLEHRAVLRRIDRNEPYQAPAWSLGLTVAALLAAIGVVMACYLLAA